MFKGALWVSWESGGIVSAFAKTLYQTGYLTNCADMVISANGAYYVMEFKVLGHAGRGAVTKQLKEKEYGKRYATDVPVHLLVFEFT